MQAKEMECAKTWNTNRCEIPVGAWGTVSFKCTQGTKEVSGQESRKAHIFGAKNIKLYK